MGVEVSYGMTELHTPSIQIDSALTWHSEGACSSPTGCSKSCDLLLPLHHASGAHGKAMNGGV